MANTETLTQVDDQSHRSDMRWVLVKVILPRLSKNDRASCSAITGCRSKLDEKKSPFSMRTDDTASRDTRECPAHAGCNVRRGDRARDRDHQKALRPPHPWSRRRGVAGIASDRPACNSYATETGAKGVNETRRDETKRLQIQCRHPS